MRAAHVRIFRWRSVPMRPGKRSHRAPRGAKRRPTPILLSLAAAAAAAAPPLYAATDTYIGPTGNWSNPLNWSLGHPPLSGDDALLKPGSNSSVAVTLDAAAVANNLLSLGIDSTNP